MYFSNYSVYKNNKRLGHEKLNGLLSSFSILMIGKLKLQTLLIKTSLDTKQMNVRLSE